jgi:hypothetical protein
VTRSFLSLRMLVVTAGVALVACGPRLKPVEYQESNRSSDEGSDVSEPSSDSKSQKATSGTSASSGGDSEGAGASASSGKGGGSKSCEDKASACGAPCTECAPGDMDCMEVLIAKQCNRARKCVPVPVDCSVPDKPKKEKDKDDAKKK